MVQVAALAPFAVELVGMVMDFGQVDKEAESPMNRELNTGFPV
jgi:hypothetical protein